MLTITNEIVALKDKEKTNTEDFLDIRLFARRNLTGAKR